MFTSVDSCLKHLFNLASKSPLPVKQIFFKNSDKVDANSIRVTSDYNTSRIPSEKIVIARNILHECYNAIEDKSAQSFFVFYYGYFDDALHTTTELQQQVAKAYQQQQRVSIEELASLNSMSYDSAEYQIRRIRTELKKTHKIIWDSVEDILLKNNLLSY